MKPGEGAEGVTIEKMVAAAMGAVQKPRFGWRRYGEWAGNPRGFPENLALCVHEVFSGWYGRQCTRRRGHGLDGLYCKQHARPRGVTVLRRTKRCPYCLKRDGCTCPNYGFREP